MSNIGSITLIYCILAHHPFSWFLTKLVDCWVKSWLISIYMLLVIVKKQIIKNKHKS